MDENWIIVFGNVKDGFEFVGPFPSESHARTYIAHYGIEGTVSVLLQRPVVD